MVDQNERIGSLEMISYRFLIKKHAKIDRNYRLSIHLGNGDAK